MQREYNTAKICPATQEVARFNPRVNAFFPNMAVILTYFIVAAIFTWPTILNIKTNIFGFPGHNIGGLWQIWWFRYALAHGYRLGDIVIAASPFGSTTSTWLLGVPFIIKALVFSSVANDIFAYNIIIFCTLIFSSFFMYLLARHITGDRRASFLAGLIYGFCPYHMLLSFDTISLAIIEWMPLYILFLFKLAEEKNYKNAIITGFLFALLTLETFYYGVFMLVFTVVFMSVRLLYLLLNEQRRGWNPKFIKVSSAALITSLLLLSPPFFEILKTTFTTKEKTEKIASRSTLGQVYAYSARPWDYILPATFHPALGQFSSALYYRLGKVHPSYPPDTNISGPNIFLGYLPIFLGIYTFRIWRKKRRGFLPLKDIDFRLCVLFIAMAATFLLSLPPYFMLTKGIKIYLPSWFLYKPFIGLRAYSRFGVVVLLCLAVISAAGLAHIFRKIKRKSQKAIIVASASLFVLFEFATIPPFRQVNLSTAPEEYTWLMNQPGDFIVAEYPFSYMYGLLFQRVHQKRLFNCMDAPPEQIGKTVENLSDPLTPNKLGAFGVRFVIVHTKDIFYPDYSASIGRNAMPDLKETPAGLLKIKSFPKASVYKVIDDSAKMLVLRPNTDNFWFNLNVLELTRAKLNLYVLNTYNKSFNLNLAITPVNASNKVVLSETLSEATAAELETSKGLSSLRVFPGENMFCLESGLRRGDKGYLRLMKLDKRWGSYEIE